MVHPICICYINRKGLMALKTGPEIKGSFHKQFNALYELDRSKTGFDEKKF